MSSPNEPLIRRAFEALNTRDLEGGRHLFHDDGELETLFTSVAGRTYRGQAGLDEWYADVVESWEELKQTPERFVPVDAERTIVLTRIQARGRGSGILIDQTIAAIWTIRDGKVFRIEGHPSMEEALAAAGGSPAA